MLNNRLTIDQILARLPSHVTLDISTYTKVRDKARFIDSEYGEFWAYPYIVFAGQAHPKRGIAKRAFAKRVKIQDIISKLPSHISIIAETYTKRHGYATFIDSEFGEFTSEVGNVITGQGNHPKRVINNRKNTVMGKYGVDSTNKVKYIQDKQSKSQNRSVKKIKWDSKEELTCIASFEAIVIDYLNKYRVNYHWQPQVFKMPNGKTYRPDLYLIDQNLWVEIKGWMRPDSKLKWDWFHSEYPNSEIWTARYKDKFIEFMEIKCQDFCP